MYLGKSLSLFPVVPERHVAATDGQCPLRDARHLEADGHRGGRGIGANQRAASARQPGERTRNRRARLSAAALHAGHDGHPDEERQVPVPPQRKCLHLYLYQCTGKDWDLLLGVYLG